MFQSPEPHDVAPSPRPPSVNFHLWQPCDMRCRYCFATFRDLLPELPKGHLPREAAIAVARLLGGAFEKVTFAGGEPLLCPWLPACMAAAKAERATTMLVTNGSRLRSRLQELTDVLDWVAISIDSASPTTHAAIGRAIRGVAPLEAADYVALADQVHAAGLRLKVNTVVSSANAGEDLSDFIRRLAPERWKVLRAIAVGGQNDGAIESMLCTDQHFTAFVDRHRDVAAHGIAIAPEDTEDIVGSYAMVDPAGRFFDDSERVHRYSAPLLEVGLDAAWAQVRFSLQRFEKRGGRYAFSRPPVAASSTASDSPGSDGPKS